MSWRTLGVCLLLCLGCARVEVPADGERPGVLLAAIRHRMRAGLDILYVAAKIDAYHTQCGHQYPPLQARLETGYQGFQHRHARLVAAARRAVLLPAAFAPVAEAPDVERFDTVATVVHPESPARAARLVAAELAAVPVPVRDAQCAPFATEMRAGDYDIARLLPEAVTVIQDAEAARARE